MKNSLVTKTLSITLSATLLATSFTGSVSAGIAPTAAAMPDFVRTLTPPENLGFVDTYYQGNSEKPVILIQDLHANVGVQRKIEGLLQYYAPKVTEGGKPMVMGIEGAWGKLDFEQIRSMAEKVRRGVSDFLLKEAEISGMDHFVALTKTPVEYYGIDDPEDYLIHRELFSKSLAARLQLASKVDKLRVAVNNAKASGSSSLRQLWKLSDDFHSGKIGLDELSKTLNTPITNYGQAEAALARAQESAVASEKTGTISEMRNVVAADRNLELLGRLFRQQLTFEEVQYVSNQVPQMLVVIQALLPGEDMHLWKDTIHSAIDHYAVALLRNKPMAAHAEDLVNQYPHSSTIIVTGGFHTAGITDDLKLKKISYIVIAPVVEAQTAHDEAIYLKRMMGIHITGEQIAEGARAFRQNGNSSVNAWSVLSARVMSWKGLVPATVVQPELDVYTAATNAFEKGTVPTLGETSPDKIVTAAAIDRQVDNEPDIQTPGVFRSLRIRLTKWASNYGITFGKQDTISIDNKPQDATNLTLSPETTNGKGVSTAVVATGAVLVTLASVNIAQGAETASTHHTLANVVNSTVNSTPLASAMSAPSPIHAVVAIGVTATAALGTWWYGFHPESKEHRQQALNAARVAIEYARQA